MKVQISRKAHFNAAHRLYRKDWDDAKNKAVFGKCSNPNFHGHNYDMIVSLTGEIDQETGFVMDMVELKEIIRVEIEEYLDHKNLNIEVPEFKELNPTAENIVIVIYERLKKRIPSHLQIEVTLYETPRNFVKYPV
jgi:6-pyruvoyltetrahydropterin/6-carboxytetrahydropterin synthase